MSPGKIFVSVVGVLAALVILSAFLGSWYTVDQGERGVILRNGAFQDIAEPGLNFKLPFIDGVREVSVQSQKREYGNADGSGGLSAYSRDQQPAVIRLSVNYRADPAQVGTLYERYGSLDNAISRLVDPQVFEEVKNVFGKFNAVTAVQERTRLNAEIQSSVQAGVGLGNVVIIDSVQIENIDFSQAYEQSIEARMLAEVEVQRLTQNAEREKVQAGIVVIQANAQADAVRANAQAQGDAVEIAAAAEANAIKLRAEANGEQARLVGLGQADAIRAKGDALRENPNLSALIMVERWDGKLPGVMPPGGTVPFLSLPSTAPAN